MGPLAPIGSHEALWAHWALWAHGAHWSHRAQAVCRPAGGRLVVTGGRPAGGRHADGGRVEGCGPGRGAGGLRGKRTSNLGDPTVWVHDPMNFIRFAIMVHWQQILCAGAILALYVCV